MNRTTLLLVLTFVFAWAFQGTSQRNFGFYGLQYLPQAHYLNPTFKSNNRIYLSIGTGTHSLGLVNSGFTMHDLFVPRAQDDSLVVSPSSAIAKMASLNFLEMNMHNELFGFGLQLKSSYFSFSLVNRLTAQFAYPKEFFQLLFEGNGGELLGKRANMDGLGLNLNSYVEYAAGFSHKFGKRLEIGSRAKLLSGIANVNTKKSVLGLTTDEETYALTLDGELDFRTSGLFAADGSGFNDFGNLLPSRAFDFKNFGYAMDFGTTFNLTDKLKLTSSLLDVGFISWKQDIRNLVQEQVNYTFDGLDMQRMFSDSTYFQDLQDSIANIFNLEENSTAYTSALPMRIIVGSHYQFTKIFGVGATYYSDFSVNRYRPTFVLTGSMKLRNWFFLNAHYMASSRSYNNFGLALCLKGAGLQFYLSTDNLMSVLNTATAKNVHLSFGLGFCIGRIDKEEKEPKAKKEDATPK